MIRKIVIAALAAAVGGAIAPAQQPVRAGRGSYAPYPPPYKARTDQHEGFNASKMLTRKIYVDETDAAGRQRPIPTNDWWTDVINNQFSGALWSYPAMVKTSDEGVTVAYPTYWNENGTEVKPSGWIRVQGANFTAAEARAADWHDWDVEINLPSANGVENIKATLVHGQPFTWFELTGIMPEIACSAAPEIVSRDSEGVLLKVGSDLYGLYLPAGYSAEVEGTVVRLDNISWISAALLPDEASYTEFKPYAASIVRNTAVSWSYDEGSSRLSTTWKVEAENLRSPGAEAPVMQGFLPHAYKHAVSSSIQYTSTSYLTPRGTMKMAAAADGVFRYEYRFSGMLPYYASPSEGDLAENGYDPAIMKTLIDDYAARGSFGGDTYWGGKGLTQMALNMTFAKQTGNAAAYELSKQRLKEALTDWLTYTPGEETKFFSYYPRWGGMLGFDVSYDSDAFNDHHFHYGYFIYASALLCMEDKAFANGYGELLTMIAKDYANYDRADTRFPFLRNLDPWAGHSYAGGLGDHGNDNGNGQESSSEAMQGWGGVYLLGVALGDTEMRDAGIFGWITESRGTVEYWFDRDRVHPERQHNYDYTLYEHPYNTNLTSKGIGWWTWFSGDPLWMHSIQWMPVSPCLNYLSEDLDFVKWDYETMRGSTAYSWYEKNGDEAPLADQSVGNVVLCYMERYDPAGAAGVFAEAWNRNLGIARGIDTGHISYFVIHSHLTYGDIDFEVSADCPTANAYRRADGSMTYMVYNPDASDRTVNFYRSGAVERTVKAPAGRLTVFAAPAVASGLEIASSEGAMVPPGSTTRLSARILDQYGAEISGDAPVWSVSAGNASVSEMGVLTVAANAARGSSVAVRAKSGNLSADFEIIVNDPPVVASARIAGIKEFVETGTACAFSLEVTDQYGNVTTPDAEWSVTAPDGSVAYAECGEAVFERAGIHTVTASIPGKTVTASLKVLPPLSNAALGAPARSSSEENAGTLTSHATDGDLSTRWGSQHSDDQWLVVDLGSDHYISSVAIYWETAYAADYDIDVAPEAEPEAWSVAHSERGLGNAGKTVHQLGTRGRYVRLRCLRRATQYGYSLHEIEIGGVPVTTSDNAVVGIDLTAPELMMEGESAPVAAASVDFGGGFRTLDEVEWSSEPAGEFADGAFRPLTYGVHTITARYGALTATRRVLVEEVVRLASLTATPDRLLLVTGEERRIDLDGENQFGGVYPLDAATVVAVVTDSDGNEAAPSAACYDAETGMFKARVAGDYKIDFEGLATVSAQVRDIADANLALGKAARATSAENDGLRAAMAVDGDLSTRWGSAFAEDQAITVDLGGTYRVNNVRVYWNKLAYATRYTVELSRDGISYTPVHSHSSWNGDTDDAMFDAVAARYVRLTGHERSTQYGTSIDELEVYGTEVVSSLDESFSDPGAAVDVYNLQGIRVRAAAPATAPTSGLLPGVYILRSPSTSLKVVVR